MEELEKKELLRKTASGMVLTLLLLGIATLAFSIQPVKAEILEPPVTEWSKTYGGTNSDGPGALVQTADGGYALVGSTNSFGTGSYDFWLIKVIESNPPDIGVPSQNPPRDNVQPYQNVTVSVNVTDAESGVKNATLYYSLTNGTTWEPPVPMSLNATTSLYEATIPGQPIGTWVRFKIVAYDIAGNNATRDGTALDFIYVVIPEFPTTAILPLFMVLAMLAFVFVKRKIPRKLET